MIVATQGDTMTIPTYIYWLAQNQEAIELPHTDTGIDVDPSILLPKKKYVNDMNYLAVAILLHNTHTII